MNELIPINENEKGEQIISGRILHDFLESKMQYTDWFAQMIKYGFTENSDYQTLTQKYVTTNNNSIERIDHAIKLEVPARFETKYEHHIRDEAYKTRISVNQYLNDLVKADIDRKKNKEDSNGK